MPKPDLVLPGLLKRLRGKTPAEDFYPKYGVRITTGKNWEYGVNTPKLGVFFGLCKMLGHEGLKELGYMEQVADLYAAWSATLGRTGTEGKASGKTKAEIALDVAKDLGTLTRIPTKTLAEDSNKPAGQRSHESHHDTGNRKRESARVSEKNINKR